MYIFYIHLYNLYFQIKIYWGTCISSSTGNFLRNFYTYPWIRFISLYFKTIVGVRICWMPVNASLLDFKCWMTSTYHHPIYFIPLRRNLSFVVGRCVFFMMYSSEEWLRSSFISILVVPHDNMAGWPFLSF